MGKTIKHLKLACFIIILTELIFLSVFCGFYLTNFTNIQAYVEPIYLLIGAIGLILINIIFVWIMFIKVSSLRQKTDLHAAEVIGSDVQEAYNFAMIGLAVTNDDGVVIWTNDLFKDRHIDIIDLKILEWQPSLEELIQAGNSETISKIVINSRNYEVKFLAEAGLWIFKDTSDYESLYKYSREQAPVVGVISIDNFADVVRGDEDYNDTISKVKNELFDYAKQYDILLRRFKDDSYSLLCNYESFSKMKNDNFSIVDKVRAVSVHEDIPLTLSIGIAHDFPDVVKLNELANAALDVAMSRGGDQVVVSAYGKDMEFIGGKTEAQEKRNRVKIRVLADSLISLIKNSSNVLIMGHTDMDMDAFGACLGIKAICDYAQIKSNVVVNIKATEGKTRAAMNSCFSKEEHDKLFVSEKETESLIEPNTLLVVVDVHIPSMVMAPSLLEKIGKVVVIDHHRRAEEYIESPVFNHIDPAASSSCELIAEFIKFASVNPRIYLPNSFATIMLSGIFLDSGYFKSRNTGMRTFEASTILKEYGADNALADDLLKDDYEEYKEVNDIVRNLKTPQYGVVYAIANPDIIYDQSTIAKASNICLAMKGVHAAFVLGKISNREIRMSARSDGLVNVQLLAEKLGGGGHFSSAACVFEKSDLAAVEEMLCSVLEKYYADAKSDAKLGLREE
ncbi:MAG: DHH family phosphoesterase [Bacilli bacterium]|nr:DHH family phosphoesterase [Bacilli bacterium]